MPAPRTGRVAPSLLVSAGVALASFASYAATACRTITWWDGSSYPLAAATLGVPSSPGSLLLTLLGWLATRLPLVRPPAFQLNLFAGLLAASLVAVVTWLSIRLATPEDGAPGAPELAGGAIAGLTLGTSVTVWTYATRFTPYVLSACFTALILAAALTGWRAESGDRPWRWFTLFLLFGLDFSVHRTNALLLPAALIAVALRGGLALRRPLGWVAAVSGLALGLAFHLLLIPLAARDPMFNMGDPTDLGRFWTYVSIGDKGGGFLFDILPRKADFVRVQLADYAHFLGRNLRVSGPRSPGVLTVAICVLGWIAAFRSGTRRALALLAFFACASLGAVLYFNLPAHWFRTSDRHYLPSLVVLTPVFGLGARTVLRFASRAALPARRAFSIGVGLLLLVAPLGAWRANRRDCDLVPFRFVETFSRDVLSTLPDRAILLTKGDNDTFPLWYLQQVEKVRPDVTVINLPCTNVGWYVAELRRHDADLAGLLPEVRRPGLIAPAEVADTAAAIPVDARADLGLPPGATAPESLTFHLDGTLFGSDRVVLDLLRIVHWRRPILLACTIPEDGVAWLQPYTRLAGLSRRIVPTTDPAVLDVELLRHELIEVARYEGAADVTLPLSMETRGMCQSYSAVLLALAVAQLTRGDARGCLDTLQFLEMHVRPELLEPARDSIGSLRAGATARLAADTPRP